VSKLSPDEEAEFQGLMVRSTIQKDQPGALTTADVTRLIEIGSRR
jgi:hypothetical protein